MRREPAWATVNAICLRAMDLAPSDQDDFVARRCDGDPGLERRVRELLDAAHRADTDGFLDPGTDDAGDGRHPGAAADDGARGSRSPDHDPDQDLQAGQRLGAYAIIRPLSAGGMGAVYLARRADAAYEREVAVKVLRASLTTPAMRERFQRERAALARLTHPGITSLLDGGTTDDGRPYLVMEYVPGESIVRYAEGHGLSVPERLRLFLAVAGAVQHAHARLIVHRDIKPSNVLVGPDGHPRLIDFGIAKLLESGRPTTGDATAAGIRTPAYASPEQIRGEPIGTFTDVHALGGLIFELLAGHAAYVGRRTGDGDAPATDEPAYRVERRICEDPPPRPSATARPAEHRRHIRGELDAIVARAMANAPADRYPSVESLADDVRRHLEHRPIAAAPPPIWRRATKYVRRNRTGVAAAALALGLVALAGGAVATSAQRARDAARSAEASLGDARLTTDVLQSVLASADPMRAAAPMTVTEVLESVGRRIDELPADRPQARGRLELVLATVHLGMTDFDAAARHASEAAAALRRAPDSDDVQADLASSLLALGRAEVELVWLQPGRGPTLALASIEEALELHRQRIGDGPDDAGVADVLTHLATATWVADRTAAGYASAAALADQALDILERSPGDVDLMHARALGAMGYIREGLGEPSAARTEYERALAIDATHPQLPVRERHQLHRALAGIAARAGEWNVARTQLNRVLQETPPPARTWGHVDVAWWIAAITAMEGDSRGAIKAGRVALALEAQLDDAPVPEARPAASLAELIDHRHAEDRSPRPSDDTVDAVRAALRDAGAAG